MYLKPRRLFRSVWWTSNLLLAVALIATAWTGVWEYSVREYLKGFSDAVVPESAEPMQKVEAILVWMRNGPPRLEAQYGDQLSPRDPEYTLNYRELLQVCGSATNAFLNLGRSAGIQTRRLLLLSPDRTTKHVVAEVYLSGRWVIVDPTFRTFLRDSRGNLLTARQLQDPQVFSEASSLIPNYPPIFSYERYTHVRLAALPLHGSGVRRILEFVVPHWDEYVNWSLLLERRSFLYLFLSVASLLCLLLVRLGLGWYADRHLLIPRFRLRSNLGRATSTFFTTPEIK